MSERSRQPWTHIHHFLQSTPSVEDGYPEGSTHLSCLVTGKAKQLLEEFADILTTDDDRWLALHGAIAGTEIEYDINAALVSLVLCGYVDMQRRISPVVHTFPALLPWLIHSVPLHVFCYRRQDIAHRALVAPQRA